MKNAREARDEIDSLEVAAVCDRGSPADAKQFPLIIALSAQKPFEWRSDAEIDAAPD